MPTWRRPTASESRMLAAIELVARGELAPEDALRLTIAPPPVLEQVRRRKEWPPELAGEARRLHVEGLSSPAIAATLRVPEGTVRTWIWPSRRRRRRAAA